MEDINFFDEINGPCAGFGLDEPTKKGKHKQAKCSKFDRAFVTEGEIMHFKLERKLEKAQAKYRQFKDVQKQEKIIQKKALKKFMKTNYLPPWYRELSETQMSAADSLHASIREDVEQGTVHRCKQALISLGLKPIINRANVALALRMCNGSDFAFLWFLMELFYDKTCINCKHPVQSYTVNEQIIMSAICHLDMITTLRQLDKLLPPPAEPSNVKQKRRKKIPSQKYESPYLEPLWRPKPKVININTMPPLPPVNFAPYDKYLDPSYVVPNESTRWFKRNISEELTVGHYEPKPTRSSLEIVTNILDQQLLDLTSGNFDRAKIMEALCKKHKTAEEIRKTLVDTLSNITRCQNSEYFHGLRQQQKQRQRIITQMELDQAKTKEDFEQLAQKYQIQTWLRLFIQDLILNIPDQKVIKLCEKTNACVEDANALQALITKNCCACNKCPYQPFDYGHQGIPKPNEIYFRGPRKNLPYKFDYEKIFQQDFLVKTNSIKRGISAALELDKYASENDAIDVCLSETWHNMVRLWNERFENNEESLSTGELQYVNRDQSSSLKNLGYDNLAESVMNKTQYNQNRPKTPPIRPPPQFERQPVSYDPKDSAMMDSLLKDAIGKMKQNGKFVLASLPDVHMLPILQEWIRARYGLIYSRKQRAKALEKSLVHFERLVGKRIKVKLPVAEDICAEKSISYGMRDIIFDKTKKRVDMYQHELRLALLDDARTCWKVMKPYHCVAGPPRDVFFAYMPACEKDVVCFRPWKVSEMVDAKSEFEKRLFKKRAEEATKI